MKIMWNDAKITGYVTSVTWAGSAKQAARTVVFSVAYSPNDKNVKTLGIKLGDKIVFYPGYPDDKKTKFVGIITQRERKSEMGELQYTATDGMMHLLRSSGTYRFANKTPEKIAQMVCRDVKVKTGSIAKTKMPIAKIFFQERPYYEIIMAAYTKAYRKNKKKYIAQMNGDKLEVIQKGKVIPNFHIRQGERITESSYTEDLDSMVNRVYIYDSNNNKIGSVSNSNWIKKYGIFQNAISVDSGNGKTEAKAELQGINKTANLTMIGDYRCVSGLGVIIEDSRTGLKGKFWIENDSHEWNGGVYTTTLELAFKNVMDIQEEDEEQIANSAGGSSTTTSNALDDVLNQARAWIGISGSTNEATQYYGYNGVAWCCIFQWSIFNKSGHGDLFMGGGKTASVSHGLHSNGNGYLALSVNDTSKEHRPISNRYKSSTWTDKSGYVYIPSNNSIIFVNDRFTDRQTAIKLVQDTYVIYALTSQTEEELSLEQIKSLKSLSTYYPTTNISVNSEQLDGYTVFNYPISMTNGWNYVKQQLNDNRDYIYDMDLQSAEAYVNSEYAVALTELEV